MPKLIQKCFDYYGQCAARIGPDPMCQIQLHTSNLFLFQRRPESCCAKLVLIWSGWPDQVLDKHTWTGSKLVCKNHRAQFWQNTNIWLPVSHFQTRLHSYTDGSDHIMQNQPGSDLVLADCQASAERILSGSKPVARIIGPAFKLIQIGCKFDLACLLERYHSLPTVAWWVLWICYCSHKWHQTKIVPYVYLPVSYTHLRAHETA